MSLIRKTRILARTERERRPIEAGAAHCERVNEPIPQQARRRHRRVHFTPAAQHNFDVLEPKRQAKAGGLWRRFAIAPPYPW